ncbi:MAG TPA: hypothetical protein LFW21_02160 [Rickettsia endosymbiont of Pyrocoelia pectoralis]|nr:hypothetical protein [Rickettsia endosymbiont of Pyrocoelia pectoralis]
MKEKLIKGKVDKLKNTMEEQEKQRQLEDRQKEKLKEWKDKEAGIIKEELSLSLEETYGDEAAIILSEIDKYIPNFAKSFKEGQSKMSYYMNAGHHLLKSGRYQEAMFAYKKAIECGNAKFSDERCHFDLNFDVVPYLVIGRLFEHEKQYDKAMAFYNKAINTKDNFKIKEDPGDAGESSLGNNNKSLAKAYLYKAELLKQLGIISESIENFNEAIQYNQFLYSAYLGKATLLKELKYFKEAIITYDKLIKIKNLGISDIPIIKAYYYKAEILKILGNEQEAIKALDNFIFFMNYCKKSKQDDVGISLKEAYLAKAESLSKLNETQEANFCKVLSAYHSNEYEIAIDFFNQALNQNGKDENSTVLCNFYKGYSLIKLNDPEKEFEAAECFDNAYNHTKHEHIQLFLKAFINFNGRVIAEYYNDVNNKLAIFRDDIIEKFITNILLKIDSSDVVIQNNINVLTNQIFEIIIEQDAEIEAINQVANLEISNQEVQPTGEDSNNGIGDNSLL